MACDTEIVEELWADIVGFEGRYQISNHGRVRSLARCNEKLQHICWGEKIMRQIVHTNGYMVVWLRKPGSKQKFFVHRLVAFAFLEAIEGKDYVNHKDKNRCHNHVRNLEFMTHQENMDHRDGRVTVCNDEPF